MQNTFLQSGNDSKWFSKKSFFKNRYVELETPPPFMAKTIFFHFDYLTPSLSQYPYHKYFNSNLEFSANMYSIQYLMKMFQTSIQFKKCGDSIQVNCQGIIDPGGTKRVPINCPKIATQKRRQNVF